MGRSHSVRLGGRDGKAVVIVLLVLLLVGGAFAAWWFLLRRPDMVGRFIPAEAGTVGQVNLRGLFASALFQELGGPDVKRIDESPLPDGLKAAIKAGNVDLARLESLTFGARGVNPLSGEVPEMVAVVRGAFDRAGLEKFLGTVAAGKGREVAGAKVYQAGPGGVSLWSEQEVVLGTGALLDKALALAGGQGTSAAADPGLEEVRSKIDTAATFWAATREIKPFADMPKIPIPGLDELANLDHVALSVDLVGGLDARFAVLFGTPGAAETFKAGLEGLLKLQKLKSSFSLGTNPMEKALDVLDVSVNGRALVARVRLEQADAQGLAQTLAKIMR